MQKDVHFCLTYILARRAGIKPPEAQQIAWADQYTDDLTEADLYGIQTQCEKIGNWGDRQIQLSVLIPFHFIPGGSHSSDWPWEVTENSARVQTLVKAALSRDDDLRPFSVGIALHALQDTFSHQGFSGWEEDKNSCYPWYYLKSALPNVGHTEMLVVPDIVDRTWVDPRSGTKIDNRKRAFGAAHATFLVLAEYAGVERPTTEWRKNTELKQQLRRIFRGTDYDERKSALLALVDTAPVRYSKISKRLGTKHEVAFMRAATEHLSEAIRACADLTR